MTFNDRALYIIEFILIAAIKTYTERCNILSIWKNKKFILIIYT